MNKRDHIFYNNLYPFQVWMMTIAIGTVLRTMTMGPATVEDNGGSVFLNELLLGIEYSLLTLAVCYITFIVLVRAHANYMLIKSIVAITGVIVCTATIMMKFKFGFDRILYTENLTLIFAYCLPLIAGCLLLRVKTYTA